MPSPKGKIPLQLARAKRPKRSEPRPLAECLPSINVNDLQIPSPYDYKTYILPNISLRYPQLASVRLSFHAVEFHLPSLHRGETTGPIQTFRLKHIKTGFGIRHAFICTCQRPVIKLYYLHRKLACRRCCNAIYVSQTLSQHQRPVLPDDASIAAAIEANDAFIAALEAIRDAAQGLTIDQDTD
jgi:hypothetical protein